MSVGMFSIFVSSSAVVLTLIIIFREALIDFEDALFAKVKGLFKSRRKKIRVVKKQAPAPKKVNIRSCYYLTEDMERMIRFFEEESDYIPEVS